MPGKNGTLNPMSWGQLREVYQNEGKVEKEGDLQASAFNLHIWQTNLDIHINTFAYLWLLFKHFGKYSIFLK